MADYIPSGDAEAIAEGRVRVDYALAHLSELGLKSTDVIPVQDALNAFESGYEQNNTNQATARASAQNKEDLRRAWETLDRDFNARLARAADDHRAAMNLKVRDTIKTDSGKVESHPLGTADTSQKLRHVVSFRDSATPDSKAKPKNAFGCDIWYKIGGDAPVDVEKECTQAGIDRSSPYLMEFEGADAGKTVYYFLRWIALDGSKGAWSPMFTATITG